MTVETLPDQESRTRAGTDFSSNLVVVAGAGTGKTSLLVERFLNLVLSEKTPIDRMVAITFTEKAAAEMRGRVADALDALVAVTEKEQTGRLKLEAKRCYAWLCETQGLSKPELSSRAGRCLEHLDGAFIGTIHAFCANLLRRNAVAADLPPTFSVDDGVTQDLFFEELWLDFLTAEFGASPERGQLWDRVLESFTEREAEETARSLARSGPASDLLAREGYRGPDPITVFGDQVRELQADLKRFQPEIPSRVNLSLLIKTQLYLFDCFLNGGVRALQATVDEILPLPRFWEKKPPAKAGKGVPEKRGKKIENRAKEATDLLYDLQKVQDESMAELMEVLRPFSRIFRERIQEEGLLSFDDLLLMTRNLLSKNPEVRKKESGRVGALLVDEFQDTDPLQYDIVFLLASAGTAPTGNPETLSLLPGRLFLVGDPKQSIYRFRGADYGAYMRAADHVLQGNEPETLVTNFRSRPSIVAAINRLFDQWTGDNEPDLVSPPYREIHPFRKSASEPAVEIWSITGVEDRNAEIRRRAEAREIAANIRSWNDEGKFEFKDVAILFRALGDVPLYTRALREENVDFVLDGGKAFADRPEVVEALAFLRALANPSDPVATLAVLRSSLGGVSDRDLAGFSQAGGRFRWKGKNPTAEFPQIEQAFLLLQRLDRERNVLPLDRWIQKTLTESEFSLLMTAYFEGAQRVANVQKLAEKAATLVREHQLTLEQTLDVLKDQLSGERVLGESPLADEAINAVRILTMHKAKGLEFPVVIIPDLARGKPQTVPRTEVRLVRTPWGEAIGVGVADRSWLRNTTLVFAAREDKSHELAEEKRVFYVAATRAREQLILVNSNTTRPTLWQRAMASAWNYRTTPGFADLPDRGLLPGDLVFHKKVVAPDGSRHPAPEREMGDVSRAAEAFARTVEEAQWKDPRFRQPSHDHRAEILESEERRAAQQTGATGLARPAGVAVHQLLERMDFEHPEKTLEHTDIVVRTVSMEHDVDEKTLGDEVRAILDGFLSSPLLRDLARVEIVGRETPVLHRDTRGATVFGYVDLVYRQDDRIHVADYKTDQIDTVERAEKYRDQLTDYAESLREALDLSYDPAMEILFVRSGTRVILPPSHPEVR